jgi:hypothetical protein
VYYIVDRNKQKSGGESFLFVLFCFSSFRLENLAINNRKRKHKRKKNQQEHAREKRAGERHTSEHDIQCFVLVFLSSILVRCDNIIIFGETCFHRLISNWRNSISCSMLF